MSDAANVPAMSDVRNNGRMERIVRLEWCEMSMATLVGVRRQWCALTDGKKNANGFDGDGWGVHIEGAAGEVAVAKAFGVYWPASVNVYKVEDLPGWHVRTRSKPHYDLMIRPNDPDGAYILVTGTCPVYTVRGWAYSAEAKRKEWWKDYGDRNKPAWFMPQRLLRQLPFPDLQALKEQQPKAEPEELCNVQGAESQGGFRWSDPDED